MINATLLIQIVNFIGAYFILKEVFLELAFKRIEEEKESYGILKRRVGDYEKHKEEQEKIKNMQQRTFTQALRQSIPSLTSPFASIQVPSLQLFELTPEEQEQLVKQLSNTIIKRVFHD